MNAYRIRRWICRHALVAAAIGFPLVGAAPQTVDIPVESAALQIIKEIPLSTEIAGILEFVDPAEEGQMVTEGQEVIRLKDDVIRAELDSARKKAELRTEVDFAEVALEKAGIDLQDQEDKNAANPKYPPFTESELRQSRLEVTKAEAQLQKAKDDIEVLKLDVKTKEAQLQQYSVVCPLDGVVTSVTRFPGQAVRQGDPVLTITDIRTLRAVMKVSNAYRDQLAVGQQVVISVGGSTAPLRRAAAAAPAEQRTNGGILSGAPGLRETGPRPQPQGLVAVEPAPDQNVTQTARTFPGVITFISPRVDPSSQLIEVYANVPNQIEGGRFLLAGGMNISAVIKAESP